jgi:hypothetical protein
MQPNIIQKTAFAGLAILITAAAIAAPDLYESAMPLRLYLTGNFTDTVPVSKKSYDKREYRAGDIDLALKEVDRAMADLDKHLKIELPDIQREIKAALAEVKKIDVEALNREIKVSMDRVDWQQLKSEISNALHEADVEVKGAVNLDDLKIHLNKELSKAKTGIAKAKTALTAMKEFTDNLEKDKLINKKQGYKIDLRGADMFINGTKQPKEVTDKYRKYFKAKDYSIVIDGDRIASM